MCLLRRGHSAYMRRYGGIHQSGLFHHRTGEYIRRRLASDQSRVPVPGPLDSSLAHRQLRCGHALHGRLDACPLANQDAILEGLRDSYVGWAIPRSQKIDNGRDYGARLFHGATLDEVRTFIRGYIAEYHQTSHRGEGMEMRSPRDAWQARAGTLRRAPADTLYLLMQIRGPSKVGANGVRFHAGGQTFWYGRDDDALRRWKGHEVPVAVDPEDVSQVVVFTPDRQLLTVVPMNDRIAPFGADAQQLRDAGRTVRRARGDRKQAMQTAAVRMRMPQDILREHQANEIRGAHDGPPPPGDGATFIPVETGFESASKAVKTYRQNVRAEPCQPHLNDRVVIQQRRVVGLPRRGAGPPRLHGHGVQRRHGSTVSHPNPRRHWDPGNVT